MATSPIQANSFNAARVSEIIGTATGVIGEVEKLLAASGVGGSLDFAQIERLTTLFGSLAGVAIQAVHDVAGKQVTPESILALLPSAVRLADPVE